MPIERGLIPQQEGGNAFVKRDVFPVKTDVAPGVNDAVHKTEKKESHFVRETHELKDKSGNVVGYTDAKYFDPLNGRQEGRLLETFELRQGDKKIDILGLIGLKPDVLIFVVKNPLDSNDFLYLSESDTAIGKRKQTVFIPPLDSIAGIAIALHEFGHAKQYELPLFAGLSDLDSDGEGNQLLKMQIESVKRLTASVEEGWTEIQKNNNTLDELSKKLNGARNAISYYEAQMETIIFFGKGKLKKQILQLTDFRDGLKHQGENLSRKTERLLETQRLRLDELSKAEKAFKETLQISKQVKERDATRRAFKWMYEIKKKLNFNFASLPVPDPSYVQKFAKKDEGCNSSTRRMLKLLEKDGNFSAKNMLLSYLASYDAFTKIPVPSLKRLEQMERDEEAK